MSENNAHTTFIIEYQYATCLIEAYMVSPIFTFLCIHYINVSPVAVRVELHEFLCRYWLQTGLVPHKNTFHKMGAVVWPLFWPWTPRQTSARGCQLFWKVSATQGVLFIVSLNDRETITGNVQLNKLATRRNNLLKHISQAIL